MSDHDVLEDGDEQDDHDGGDREHDDHAPPSRDPPQIIDDDSR